MSNKQVIVKVMWERWKMKFLPKGNTYSTVARFADDINWPEIAWSINLLFKEPPTTELVDAKASFLSENSPPNKLESGKSFELYEGYRKSATVFIL